MPTAAKPQPKKPLESISAWDMLPARFFCDITSTGHRSIFTGWLVNLHCPLVTMEMDHSPIKNTIDFPMKLHLYRLTRLVVRGHSWGFFWYGNISQLMAMDNQIHINDCKAIEPHPQIYKIFMDSFPTINPCGCLIALPTSTIIYPLVNQHSYSTWPLSSLIYPWQNG